MNFPEDQVNELKAVFPGVSYATEGGNDYFLISNLLLPEPASPRVLDVLLCPNMVQGYNSRLYFASQVQTGKNLNWNGQNTFILGRQWHAFSWQLPQAERRLVQMVAMHLKALTS